MKVMKNLQNIKLQKTYTGKLDKPLNKKYMQKIQQTADKNNTNSIQCLFINYCLLRVLKEVSK